MSQVRIERWHSRYRSASVLREETVRAWDAAVGDLRMDPVLDGLAGDEAWIFVRSVRLQQRWGMERGRADAMQALRAELLSTLRRMLAEGHADVVRYADPLAAATDFLYRAVAGDTTRAWVWQQLGWLPAPSGSSPVRVEVGTQRSAAVATLRAHPTWIWPVLARLVDAEAATAALTLLFAALPDAGWAALWQACPRTQAFQAAQLTEDRAGGPGEPDVPPGPLPAPAQGLLAWAGSRPWQARARMASLRTWLAAALEASPQPVSVHAASRRLEQAECLLQACLGGYNARREERSAWAARETRPIPLPVSRREEAVGAARDTAAVERTQTGAPEPGAAGDAPPELEHTQAFHAPVLPEPAAPIVTHWGGMLFLLNLIPGTGVLAELERMGQDGALPPLLWHIAARLGAPPGEPIYRAFCGGWTPLAGTDGPGGPELPPPVGSCVELALDAMERWLTDRVPERPGPRLPWVARRQGRLRIDPGWIVLTLPLDQVDVGLRRAGIDLDPAWLPWLGCVVRFVYE